MSNERKSDQNETSIISDQTGCLLVFYQDGITQFQKMFIQTIVGDFISYYSHLLETNKEYTLAQLASIVEKQKQNDYLQGMIKNLLWLNHIDTSTILTYNRITV